MAKRRNVCVLSVAGLLSSGLFAGEADNLADSFKFIDARIEYLWDEVLSLHQIRTGLADLSAQNQALRQMLAHYCVAAESQREVASNPSLSPEILALHEDQDALEKIDQSVFGDEDEAAVVANHEQATVPRANCKRIDREPSEATNCAKKPRRRVRCLSL